jgi:CheY-like chemotaxis protein
MSRSEPIRILCAEDDPGTARLLQKSLTHAGYSVDLAQDGEQGLTMYRSGSYNALCVDHQMPGFTGLEVIRALSAEGILPPTIMVTGAGDEAVAVEAMRLGASDYVIKDSGNRYFDLIPTVIKGALEKQRLVDEKRLAEQALQKAHDELEVRVQERTEKLARANEELQVEINQRKQAEEQMRQQHEFLDTVLESLTHPFYVIDANDYSVEMANSASGLRSPSRATTCYALTHQRDTPCESSDHPCPLRDVKKTKKTVVVEHIHHDDKGNRMVVEIHAYPIFDGDGNVSKVIEYALDVTARKKAEERLFELLETSSNIVKNIPSGLLIYQYQAPGELFLVNANHEATRLTGITVDKWRGQEFDEMWPNARVQGLTQALLRTMSTGETFAMECGAFKTDEIERFFRLRAFSMPGDLLGLSFEDITELKQMEHQIRENALHGPITEALSGADQASDHPRAESLDHRLRLLLIIDVAVVAAIVRKGLINLGQSATVVSSSREALDAITSEEFSAIVCDLTMPETNGRQVAKELKDFCQETGLSRPPFVLMTQEGMGEEIPGSEVDIAVEKPIDVGRLLQILRNLVN